MPGMRRPGMDQDYYDWSPINTRATLRWPNSVPLAFCVVVSLEHFEWNAPEDSFTAGNIYGFVGQRPFPNMATFSHREYGNRVGIFRVMELLDKYDIKATVALDASVARHYPFIVQECKRRDWEFIGHGISINRMISSNMSEDEERAYINESLVSVEEATGQRPVGWLGPEYGESTRTPAILAEEGVKYVCDWPNDEQPYRMHVPNGTMTSLPIMLELDDAVAHWYRRVTMPRWTRMVKDCFDVLHHDGASNGRLMVLNLHPWLIGQPNRIGYLDEVLGYICGHQDIWKATGEEIVSWYVEHS